MARTLQINLVTVFQHVGEDRLQIYFYEASTITHYTKKNLVRASYEGYYCCQNVTSTTQNVSITMTRRTK